jgi:DNA phosphorothioation-dependent restriction protein DptG
MEAEETMVTFRCPQSVKAKLDAKAKGRGKTLSAIVLSCIEIGLSDETIDFQPGELRAIIRSLQVSGRGTMARKMQLKLRAKRSP